MILAIKPSPTDNDLPIVKSLDAVEPESNIPLDISVIGINGDSGSAKKY